MESIKKQISGTSWCCRDDTSKPEILQFRLLIKNLVILIPNQNSIGSHGILDFG